MKMLVVLFRDTGFGTQVHFIIWIHVLTLEFVVISNFFSLHSTFSISVRVPLLLLKGYLNMCCMSVF